VNQTATTHTTAGGLVPLLGTTTTFIFDGQRVRVSQAMGEPWFVATDIAGCLGYRDAGNMLRNLDEDEKGTHNVSSPLKKLSVISEPGLFHAVNNRRLVKGLSDDVKDRIVRFQRWVNHEVLPAIRRTGSYALPSAPAVTAPTPFDAMAFYQNPDNMLALAAHYAQRTKIAEAAVEAAQPAVDFCGALADSDDTWGLQAAGKALHQGPNRFIGWLKDRGDLFDLGEGPVPKQPLIDRKLFVIVWREFGGKQRPTTRLTGKGVVHYARELGVRPPQSPPQALLPGF